MTQRYKISCIPILFLSMMIFQNVYMQVSSTITWSQKPVAERVHMFLLVLPNTFSKKNGGNIANAAYIVTNTKV